MEREENSGFELKSKKSMEYIQRYLTTMKHFGTKFRFVIPISFQPNVVVLWCLKLGILLIQIIEFWNIKGLKLRLQRYRDKKISWKKCVFMNTQRLLLWWNVYSWIHKGYYYDESYCWHSVFVYSTIAWQCFLYCVS